jgi:hypothetical protein
MLHRPTWLLVLAAPRSRSRQFLVRLVLLISAIGSFLLWTLPVWSLFWQQVASFPVLWQEPANRWPIILLCLRLVAPLLIPMLLTEAFESLFLLLRGTLSSSTADHQGDQGGAQDRVDAVDRVPMPGLHSNRPGASPETTEPGAGRSLSSMATALAHGVPASISRSSPQDSALEASLSSPAHPAVVPASPSHSLEQAIGSRPLAYEGSLPPALVNTFQRPVHQQEPTDAKRKARLLLRVFGEIVLALQRGGEEIPVSLGTYPKRQELLAYLAWHRQGVPRDQLLEEVFGHGQPDEEAHTQRLSERFDSHRKILRRRVREALIAQGVLTEREALPAALDPFASEGGIWRLASGCQVIDLDMIQGSYGVLTQARKEGRLVQEVPREVMRACEELLAAYRGDFLASYIQRYPELVQPWEGRSSWIRKPFTQGRDWYLEALWWLGEAEWREGLTFGSPPPSELALRQQRQSFARAAQCYADYALAACATRFDSKVSFGSGGEPGERVLMSERALRRAVLLWGSLSQTGQVDQLWRAYWSQMRRISDRRWEPRRETLADLETARAQTNAYRLALQLSQQEAFSLFPSSSLAEESQSEQS